MEERKNTIRQWAEDDRPREKLIRLGRRALSDAELLAILISSGNERETALDLSRRLLSEAAGNSLNRLARLSVGDLQKFRGIGEAKAITIIAALELSVRRREAEKEIRPTISGSKDAFQYIEPLLSDLSHEEFYVIYLNRANVVISHARVSSGGITGTVVDARMVYKGVLDAQATSIILCHNHPSGNLRPSNEDISLTKKLKDGGKLLDINVLDHLIVCNNAFYSFADDGLI